jgi:phosphoglycerate dehydrogenase-like enzyme
MRVHLKGDYSGNDVQLLSYLTGGEVVFTSGPLSSENSCKVLVGGVISAEEVALCPGLKRIVVPYAGIPDETLRTVRSFPGLALHNIHHNAVSAAEMAITLMLAASKLIVPADKALRSGDWSPRYRAEGRLIEGSRILVLGWGSIGRKAGAVCAAMGALVTGIKRNPSPGLFTADDLHRLLPETDILMICVPLTDMTRGMIGEEEIEKMPRGGTLVNVARAMVVAERALYDNLLSGHLGAAGLDVWYRYPDSVESRGRTEPSRFDFGSLPNVVMSPHRGGAFGLEELEGRRLKHIAGILLSICSGDENAGRVDTVAGY